MRTLLLTSIFLSLLPLAHAEAYNFEEEIEFDSVMMILQSRDEGWHSSINSDDGILRSKKVIALDLVAPEGTYFDDDQKASLIVMLRAKCQKLGKEVMADQEVKLAEENTDLEIVMEDSYIPDTTLNVINPDRVFGRCHIDYEAE